jgi:glycosyltransferase involved in cell wall biosynthesis
VIERDSRTGRELGAHPGARITVWIDGLAGMRVVQVALDCVPENGGTTTAVRDFQSVLSGDVISFTQRSRMPVAPETHVTHVPYDGVIGRAYARPGSRALARAAPMMRDSELMIIHGLFRYHVQWAWRMARMSGTPYWLVPHGILDPYVFTYRAWQKRPWMWLLGQRILDGASRVVFATEREREKAARHVEARNATVIHWPVDDQSGDTRDIARQRIRRGLCIPTEDRLLLFVGRLHPMKRVLETIDVVARARAPGVHLVIIGPDTSVLTRAACERFARERGATRVHLIGPVFGSEKWDYFAAADGFVSLSHRENFGYTTAEAVAFGLPAILSPGNDLAAELRAACGPGWTLDSLRDADAIGAVERFGAAPTRELRTVGRCGREWAHHELGRNRFAERVLELAALMGTTASRSATPA